MKNKIIMIMLLMLIALAAVPAQAQTITFSNPGSYGERDILVFQVGLPDAIGLYNTTSTITTDGNESYIFALVPQTDSLIDDPGDWLTNTAFPYVRTHIIAILLIMFCIGLYLRSRYG